MEDDSVDHLDGGFDAEAFEEWIDQIAQKKGTPKQEIVDRMMSSFWILDELSGMMDEPPHENPSDSAENTTATRSPDVPPQTDTSERTSPNDVEKLLQSIQELRDELQGGQRGDPVPGHSESAQPQSQTRPQTNSDPQHTAETARDQPVRSERIQELEYQVRWLASEFDKLDDELDSTTAELRAELEAITQQLDATAANAESAADEEDLSELASRIDQLKDDVQAQQDSLEDHVTSEFEQLSEILSHLVEQDDQLASQVTSLATQYQSDISRLLEYHQEQSRLTGLKQTAAQLNITTAACEGCGEKISLPLLEEPRCPNCGGLFGSISEKEGWFRGQDTLVTVPERPDPDLNEVEAIANELQDSTSEDAETGTAAESAAQFDEDPFDFEPG